jgi:hypothetical protein
VKLHSPQFEKTLRSGVRKAIKSSRMLKREFRAANRFRRHFHLRFLLRPGGSLLFALLVREILVRTGEPATALAIINLWAFAFAAVFAQRFLSGASGSGDPSALALLPVEEATIFRWEMQKCIRGSLWFLFDLICGYGVFALHHDSPTLWIAVLSASILTWAHVLALAALGAAHRPQIPFGLILGAIFVGSFIVLIARSLVGNAALALLSYCAPTLNLILPTGWPASVFQAFLPAGYWPNLILLVPVAATIWTWKGSIVRLRMNYQFAEFVVPESPDLIPDDDEIEVTRGNSRETPVRIGPTEIEQIIVSRKFLAPPSWRERSWIERWLWSCLNQREMALADFLFVNGLDLMSSWKRLFRNHATTCIAAVVVSILVNAGPAYWILAGGFFITLCHAIFLLAGSGSAFEKVWCGGVSIPQYAGYGIGFREMARLLFKLSAVQAPFLVLYSITAAMVLFFIAGWPLGPGLLCGLKVAGLLFMSRFVLLVFAISAGTDDTSRLRIRSLILLGVVAGVCLVFLGLAAASLLVPEQSVAWSLWAAAAVCAYGFLRIYGWFYHANFFDLMNVPQQQ